MYVKDATSSHGSPFEGQELFRLAFDHAAIGMALVALDGKWLDVNFSLCNMLGYGKDEMLKLTFRDITHPDDIEDGIRLIDSLLRGDRTFYQREKRYIHRSGGSVWAYLTVSLLRGQDGHPLYLLAQIQDITAAKNDHAQVGLLAAIVEHSDDAIFSKALDGTIKSWNQGAERIYGYTASEIIGKNITTIVPDHKLAELNQILSIIRAGGRVKHLVTDRLRKDGRVVTVSVTLSPVKNHDGVIIGTSAIARDISERKLAEDALYREKERLRVTLESIGDGVIVVDCDERVTMLNKVAEQLTGWRASDAAGRSIGEVFKIVHEYTGKTAPNPVALALREGKIVGLANHTALIAKDGVTRSIADSASPVRDTDESLLGAILVFRDVTAERKNEEALKSSEARFRNLAENASDLIYRLQILPQVKMDYVSPAAERITGYTAQELYAHQDLLNHVLYDDVPLVQSIVDGLIAFNQPIEVKWLGRNGGWVWTEQKLVPIHDDDGHIIAVEGIARDVTERKRIEQELNYMSFHDVLTELHNRRRFEEHIRDLQNREEHPLGVIVCDVDGLKLVNDTLGHEAGDRLLVGAATVLRRCFRKGEMLARIGGDEFIAVLSRVDQSSILNICKRLRDSIERYNEENLELPLSISIGFACGSSHQLEDLFKEADNNMYREKLHQRQSARSGIVHTLMKALEARDFITEGHATRLSNLIELMGKALGLSAHAMSDLRLLAQFHDIGKVGIPDRILFKPEPLTEEERAEMRRHSEIGYRIALSAPDLAPIAPWILKHHEWWDGEGYPFGLEGEDIPLECRILAVVDAFDAMTSDRPYRRAMTQDEALQELYRCSGTQFDPTLIPVLESIVNSAPVIDLPL